MYCVDQSKIEEVLGNIQRLLEELPKHSSHSFLEKLPRERMTRMNSQSIVDVGVMRIEALIVRHPGSRNEIIDILLYEKVIPSDDEKMYKEIISLRNMLVKEYMQVEHNMLQNTVLEHKEVLDHFSAHIRTYLTNETGVANAFSNES